MNHFADILSEVDETHNFPKKNILISDTIDKIESGDCVNSKGYSLIKYKKLAKVSLAFGLMTAPCMLNNFHSDNKFITQTKADYLDNCFHHFKGYSIFEKEHSLTEEENIAIAVTYMENFKTIPPKKSVTLKTTVNHISKGRPSRI